MKVIATLIDPVVVRRILEHLGVRASPLPRAPPRDPGDKGEEPGDAYPPRPGKVTRSSPL